MATVPDPKVDTEDTSAEASIGAKFSQSEVQTEAQNELWLLFELFPQVQEIDLSSFYLFSFFKL